MHGVVGHALSKLKKYIPVESLENAKKARLGWVACDLSTIPTNPFAIGSILDQVAQAKQIGPHREYAGF